MVKQVVGTAAAVVCLLFGGFLVLVSSFALLDGERDPVVYCYVAVGAGLVLGGFVLLVKLPRRRAVKRTPEGDECW